MELLNRYYTVHKFGGSSLATAKRFIEVKKILKGTKEVVVASATQGTTAKLDDLLNAACAESNWQEALQCLFLSHQVIIETLLPKDKQRALIETLSQDFASINSIFNTVAKIGSYTSEIHDFILGYGEQWSAQILAAYLGLTANALYLDASKIIFTYKKHNHLNIDWEKSEAALIDYCQDKDFDQLVITAFIASTLQGKRTTLGRNGGDFSGAIFARLFHAAELYIWTNVDGIFTAHPNKVNNAFCIESLSYKEALELAYFGANVLHPMTIAPAEAENIPIYIKNSYNQEAHGTLISYTSTQSSYGIKGLTYVDNIALINIEGAGLSNVSGNAARIFQIMQECDISVILISQASSEHSLCMAIHDQLADKAIQALNMHLRFEIETKRINKIKADTHYAILAIVGDGMIGNRGIAGKLFATLAKTNINIRAIAQGSSERNISAVIESKDINRALQAVHASFYLADRPIAIGIIGPGGIGATLLNQLTAARHNIKKQFKVDLCVRGIINRKKMLLTDNALTSSWQNQFNETQLKANLDEFINHLISDDIPHAVIIDCTADAHIAKQYLSFFNKGINVITPNKHANAGDLDYYQQIKAAARHKGCHYLYEATVCAGLPVINTLQDLLKTGDEIVSIEGVVSGTLSYIFNELSHGRLFSEIVKAARGLGYTEPDPREDLSGQDVARKLVCLARESGFNLSLADIKVTSLVPEQLRDCSIEEFLAKLPNHDDEIQQLASKAKAKNEKLCYVGKIYQNQKITLAIESVPLNHSLASLSGTDNIIILQTKRYYQRPMIIQGPGAGAEVTATGVFTDLLRLTSYLY
jgi:bifunctional aspartokinase / homoserine dehydrogenase 1